jgi:peptidoglycan-N-acetylglucosamine deacetylase
VNYRFAIPLAALVACFALGTWAIGRGWTAGRVTARPRVVAAQAREASGAIPARYRGQIIRKRVRHFPTKLLALSFDDGPDPVITPQVLATLRRHQAHATFFVLGKCAKTHPELVAQAAREGHAIGSHTYSHAAKASPAQAREELSRTATIIGRATGQAPTVFRPPYGITTGNLCRTALSDRYAVILWTISTADSNPIAAAVIAHNAIHTPNPGDIILMHDGQGHVQSAKALDQILTELGQAGFQFVTVPELLSAWDGWLNTPQGRQAAAMPARRSKH